MALHLTADIQEKLKSVLIEEGLVDAEVMQKSEAEAARTNRDLETVLINSDIVDEELIVDGIAYVSGVPYINLTSSIISQENLGLLRQDIAERLMAVPLAEVRNRLAVAMVNAGDVQAVDYLSTQIQRPVKVFMASEASIKHVLDQYKTDLSAVDKAADVSQAESIQESAANIKTIVQDSPISRALSTILEYAVKTRASDVHVEPLEDYLLIRFRIDGVLREVMRLPKTIEPALVSRIKIL